MKRPGDYEPEGELYPRKRLRKRDESVTEEYILSGQPIELLLTQLSDPSITLQDVESVCATNREIRKLCKTDPWFIKLKEGKRISVSIRRSPLEESDFFSVYIYSYQGSIIISNTFSFSFSEKEDEDISNILATLNEKKRVDFDLLSVILDPGYEGEVKIPYQIVEIRHPDYLNYTVSGLYIPYTMFESIMLEAKRLVDRRAYGDLNILVNGDVVYTSLWTTSFDPVQNRYIQRDIL